MRINRILLILLFCLSANIVFKVEAQEDSVKVKTLSNEGVDLLNVTKIDEAINKFEAALKINPNFVDAVYNLGVAYGEKNQPDNALKYFERALELYPQDSQAAVNVGYWNAKLGRYSEAIKAYQMALKIDPNYLKAHLNIAETFASGRQRDKAKVHYLAALQIDSGNPKALYELSQLYRESREDRLAIPLEQHFLALPDLETELVDKQVELQKHSISIVKDQYYQIPGTGLFIKPPLGFILSNKVAGFSDDTETVFITGTETIPAKFDSVIVGIKKGGFTSQSYKVLSEEKVSISGAAQAKLIRVERSARDILTTQLFLVIGNSADTKASIVTLSYPNNLNAEQKEQLLPALKTTKIDASNQNPDLLDGLNFRIAPIEPFKIAVRLQESLVISKNGVQQGTNAAEPLILINFIPQIIDKELIKEVPLALLKSNKDIDIRKLYRPEPYKVSGFPVYTAFVQATDKKSGTELISISSVLRSSDGYYQMLASAPWSESEAFYKLVRDSLSTFTRSTRHNIGK